MADVTVAAKIDSSEAKKGATEFNNALGSMRGAATSAADGLKGLAAGAIAAFTAVTGLSLSIDGLKKIAAAADDVTRLGTRLRALGSTDATAAMEGLRGVSERSRTSFADVAKAYTDMAGAMQDRGRSASDAARAVESLAKASQISGLSAEDAAQSMDILARAVNAGKIEFGAFAELTRKIPVIMQEMQAQTGMTAKELKRAAELGKLSGVTITDALVNASQKIDAQFANVPRTVTRAWSEALDGFDKIFGKAASESGAATKFIDVLDRVKEALKSDEVKGAVSWAAGAMGALADGIALVGDAAKTTTAHYRAFTDSLKDTPKSTTLLGGVADYFKGKADEFSTYIRVGRQATEVIDEFNRKAAGTFRPKELRGSVFASSELDAPSKAPKKPEMNESEAEKQARNLLQIEQERMRLLQAQRNEDFAAVRDATAEMEVRQKVTKEIREASPALAAQIEAQVRLNAEAQRQVDAVKVAKAAREEFAQTDILQAQMRGHEETVRLLTVEKDLRARITEDMREANPLAAALLEKQIRQNSALDQMRTKLEEARAVGDDIGRELTSGVMASARAGESFASTMRKALGNIAEMVIKFTVMEPLAKSIGKSLQDGLAGAKGGAGGFGSLLSGVFGGGGGATDPTSWATTVIPAFAAGGVVGQRTSLATPGGMAIAGERGPEAIMPLTRGPDGKLGVRAMSSAGSADVSNVVNINISVAGDATADTVEKLRQVARTEIAAATGGIVKQSVGAVADNHRRDARYLRR